MFGLQRIIAILDQFPQSQQFRVSARNSKLHSVSGAFGAIALVIISIIYAVQKVHVLAYYLDTKITKTVTDNVFTGQDFVNITVGEDMPDYGIPFGFTYTFFEKDFSWPKDLDRIGTLRISNNGHFFDPVAQIDLDPEKVLNFNDCTQQQLAEVGGHDKNIPAYQIPQYKCLNVGQQISLTSDKQSNVSSLFLDFIPCNGSHCYPKKIIDQRLDEIRIEVIYSHQQFDESEYSKTPIKITNNRLQTKPNMNQHFKSYLMRNQITLNDKSVFNFFNGAAKQFRLFDSEAAVLEGFDKSHLFRFELKVSTSLSEIQRENYTLLQFIGDVGALHSALFILIKLFLSTFLGINVLLQNYLLNGVFRMQNVDSISTVHINLTYFEWIQQIPFRIFSMCCCKLTRYQTIHKVGMRRIERELDIVYFLRKQFEMRAIIKALSSKNARSLARRQQNLIVNDLKDSGTTETETASDFDASVFVAKTKLEHDLFNSLEKITDFKNNSKITTQFLEQLAQSHRSPLYSVSFVDQTAVQNSILELKSITSSPQNHLKGKINDLPSPSSQIKQQEFSWKVVNRNQTSAKLKQ